MKNKVHEQTHLLNRHKGLSSNAEFSSYPIHRFHTRGTMAPLSTFTCYVFRAVTRESCYAKATREVKK